MVEMTTAHGAPRRILLIWAWKILKVYIGECAVDAVCRGFPR
jgi:hypothetical protein